MSSIFLSQVCLLASGLSVQHIFTCRETSKLISPITPILRQRTKFHYLLHFLFLVKVKKKARV